MRTSPTLALDVCQRPDVALAVYGKTFRWASRLLGRNTGSRVSALYGFCRYADELADTVGGAEGRSLLEALKADLASGWSAEPAVQGFLKVARELAVDLEPARLLVQGVESDLEPRGFARIDDLRRYGYLVAGTVGLLMCALVGVKDSRAQAFAIDLGIGMQFTNIARDVLEDAHAGRLYLPLEWLDGPLDPKDLVQDRGAARARALAAITKLLALANEHYTSADKGLGFLPWRARAAVKTASRCYEAIGPRILSRGAGYWNSRTFVGTGGKLMHTLGALASLACEPRLLPSGPAPTHSRELHAGLQGLPGADA